MAVQEESEFSLLLDGVRGRAKSSPLAFRREQPDVGPGAAPALGCAPSAITVAAGPGGEHTRSGMVSARGRNAPSDRGSKRRTFSLAMMRLDAEEAPQAGRDATGDAQRVSLAKMAWYYHAHLASCPGMQLLRHWIALNRQ